MIWMVNGYVCRDCFDEELAKKYVDPLRANDLVQSAENQMRDASARVTPNQGLGENRPDPSRDRGRMLDMLA